jgi:hypothetical protein
MDFIDYEEPEVEFDPERLDVEWAGLNALRELLRIAAKGLVTPTYIQTLLLGEDLAPEIFGPSSSLIGNALEPTLVREYRQVAEAESQISNRQITPEEVIDRDIENLERLLTAQAPKDRIRRRLDKLHSARRYLHDEALSENQIITRDVFKVERPELPSPPIDTNTYREYRLPYGRGLRIRMLHPEKPEHATGADLVYEISSEKYRKARLALVQYKIWDGDVLYLSDERVAAQLARLKSVTCDENLCECDKPNGQELVYRLPCCAAFLRPTNRLQSPNARLISKGLHIPLCIVNAAKTSTGRGGEKLLKKAIGDKAVSQRIFEELFNRHMIGSRWLDFEEVETFYREKDIMDAKDRLVLHAQEFSLISEHA